MSGPRETSDEFLKEGVGEGRGAKKKVVQMVARILEEKDTLKDVEKVLIYGVLARLRLCGLSQVTVRCSHRAP